MKVYELLMELASDVFNGKYTYLYLNVGVTPMQIYICKLEAGIYEIFLLDNNGIKLRAVVLMNHDQKKADVRGLTQEEFIDSFELLHQQGCVPSMAQWHDNTEDEDVILHFNSNGDPFEVYCRNVEKGVTVWNRVRSGNPEQIDIATISFDGTIDIVGKDLPDAVLDYLLHESKLIRRVYDGEMPDASVSITERNNYGYKNNKMLPLRRERAAELFNDDFLVFMIYPNSTDNLVTDLDEITFHEGLFGVEVSEWETYINGYFQIYQVLNKPELTSYLFTPYHKLLEEGLTVNRDNYSLVHCGSLKPDDTLDKLYQTFNIDHPKNYRGRSMSVSDVVVIMRKGKQTIHYVDNIGFKELDIEF